MVRIAGLDPNNEFESESVKDHIKNLAASAVDVSGLASQVSGAVAHQTVADRLDIDLGVSVNEISEVTSPTNVYFKDVTTADGRTNPDGMGTLLIVEKGADMLTWPGGTRIHGRPPVDSESFASLVRVSGTVHVIWTAVDSTPPPVSGGTGSDVVLATLDDVLQGKIILAPGGSVINSGYGVPWRFMNLENVPSEYLVLVNGAVYITHSGGGRAVWWANGSIDIKQGEGQAMSVSISLPKQELEVPPEPGSGWIIATLSSDASESGAEYFHGIQGLIPESELSYVDPKDQSTPEAIILPLREDSKYITIGGTYKVASYELYDPGNMFPSTIDTLVRPLSGEELHGSGINFVFEYLSPERMAEYTFGDF